MTQITLLEYRSDRKLSRETTDFEADGEVERVTEYTYDAEGNLLTQESTATDEYADPVWLLLQFDENGNVVSEQEDRYGDGNVRSVTYAYDSDQRLVEEVVQEVARTEYAYDESGNLLTTTRLSEGELQSRITYDYSCW